MRSPHGRPALTREAAGTPHTHEGGPASRESDEQHSSAPAARTHTTPAALMARPDRTLSARELHERLCSEGAEDDRADQDAAAAERLGDHYDPLPDWHPWLNRPATPASSSAAPNQPDHTTSEEDHHTMPATTPQTVTS